MRDILYEYQINATTWVYLSSLIIISVYFKFRRLWSIRNLDLLGLIAFAPGLLLVTHDKVTPALERFGYVWLFCVGAIYLVRLLLDSMMVRRPMLEPNLSASGLAFAGATMLVFLIGNIVTPRATTSDYEGAQWMDRLFARQDSPEIRKYLKEHGPGYPLFFIFSTFSKQTVVPGEQADEAQNKRALTRVAFTRGTAIIAHLAVVLAMIFIGYRHFDNIHTGMAAATLYLLLPYTAQFTPRLDHVVPAALLVWAIQCYRQPAVAGILVGLAAGTVYYPLFLLPLWGSFYWRRGLVRFSLGVLGVMILLIGLLVFTSADLASFAAQLRQMFGFMHEVVRPNPENLKGFWADAQPVFRLPAFAAFLLPVLVAYVVLCVSMAIWPAQKNLGTLLSCSAAVLLGAQFCKSYEGGTFMAWYLPLLILTIFRPNLEDRVALSAITEGWVRWRKK
jgi:hypothetical protein